MAEHRDAGAETKVSLQHVVASCCCEDLCRKLLRKWPIAIHIQVQLRAIRRLERRCTRVHMAGGGERSAAVDDASRHSGINC